MLKVLVQERPEREAKRKWFWCAVDALRTVAKENDDFVLAPSSFGIHDSKELEPLGTATENGYQWDTQALRRAMPEIDTMTLKKAMLRQGRKS